MLTLLKNFAEVVIDPGGSGAKCDPAASSGSFFGLPHWYQYLPGKIDEVTGHCTPVVTKLTDIWAIALAAVDILLRIGGIVAVVFVIYGGFQYMTSQGEPERTTHAKDTILNALIGLVIVIVAILAVNFIGATIK